MAKKELSTADQIMKHAREAQPELWERTEQVARIIDPAAFATGWIINPADLQALHESRQGYMRAIAMQRAQEVLRYLGVNTDADWYEILNRIAQESAGGGA